MVASIWGNACNGRPTSTIEDCESVVSKPGRRLLGTKPGGGTRPTREPIGNTVSSARTGAVASVAVSSNSNATVRAIMDRLLGAPGCLQDVIGVRRDRGGVKRHH